MASAQQIFKDLDAGKWKPFYLIVGEEPFQAGEIFSRIKGFFVKGQDDQTFNFESFDGEGLDVSALSASLEMLPGLFAGENEARLVVCQRFDKVSSAALEALDSYFKNPSPTTCFLMTATKADKRKGWYKKVDELGQVVEVSEPYDREWPKWQGYFEKKANKQIEGAAWERLVESSGRSLSVLWSEVQKASVFVGERDQITEKDLMSLVASSGGADVFAFADDVVAKRSFEAMKRYQALLQSGENEIKILSILVRQFRMVEQCGHLVRQGITDSKTIAPKIGAHPFFVPKIIQQSKLHSPETLSLALNQLAECDFKLKTGAGGLFENFLVSYLS